MYTLELSVWIYRISPVFELKRKQRHSSTTAATDNIIIILYLLIYFPAYEYYINELKKKRYTTIFHNKTFTYLQIIQVAQRPYNHYIVCMYTAAVFKIYSLHTTKNLTTLIVVENIE